MGHRFKVEELREMIRALVRSEIKSVVVETINEVLSERYLKRLAEAAASRPRGVGPTMHIADGDDHEEEEAPRVLSNPTRGVYGKHPMKHDDQLEDDEPQQHLTTIPEGVERDDMMSMFFEGTKPLAEIEAKAEEGVPLPIEREERRAAEEGRQPITEVWRTLAGVKPVSPAAAPSPEERAALEKREADRLRMIRESLERKPQ